MGYLSTEHNLIWQLFGLPGNYLGCDFTVYQQLNHLCNDLTDISTNGISSSYPNDVSASVLLVITPSSTVIELTLVLALTSDVRDFKIALRLGSHTYQFLSKISNGHKARNSLRSKGKEQALWKDYAPFVGKGSEKGIWFRVGREEDRTLCVLDLVNCL